MYHAFYHLKKEPFHITPDPEFLFLSPSHKEALGSIIYGVKNILAHQDDLGWLISREQGKPFAEGRGEVAYAASHVQWFAARMRARDTDILRRRWPPYVRAREPVGESAAITPWNFPAAMIARKIDRPWPPDARLFASRREDTPLTSLALGNRPAKKPARHWRARDRHSLACAPKLLTTRLTMRCVPGTSCSPGNSCRWASIWRAARRTR